MHMSCSHLAQHPNTSAVVTQTASSRWRFDSDRPVVVKKWICDILWRQPPFPPTPFRNFWHMLSADDWGHFHRKRKFIPQMVGWQNVQSMHEILKMVRTFLSSESLRNDRLHTDKHEFCDTALLRKSKIFTQPCVHKTCAQISRKSSKLALLDGGSPNLTDKWAAAVMYYPIHANLVFRACISFWGVSGHLSYSVLSLDGLKLCKFVSRSDLVLISSGCLPFLRLFIYLKLQACIWFLRCFRQKWRTSVFALFA